MKRGISLLIFVLALACLSALNVRAQITATATLQGTVTDKSGAVIPGAEVKATNKQTGEVCTATSNSAGLYSFNLLPAGVYEVRVSVRGFNTAAFENFEVAVSRTPTIDAQLALSQQSEVVTVEAAGAGLVDLQKTDASLPVTPTEVEDLPLNGRDFVNLAILVPGARPVPSYDPTKNCIGVFATNGSSGRNVNMTVNGVDDKDGTVGGPVMRQQFGGSIGGPVKKDKTFLFFAIEREREQTSIDTLGLSYTNAQALAAISLPYGLGVSPVQTIGQPYYDWRAGRGEDILWSSRFPVRRTRN